MGIRTIGRGAVLCACEAFQKGILSVSLFQDSLLESFSKRRVKLEVILRQSQDSNPLHILKPAIKYLKCLFSRLTKPNTIKGSLLL